jgi:hypothetical protein
MLGINYTELKNGCQRHWLTSGPNLEGEAGYALLDGRMYYWTWFFGEDKPKIEHHSSVLDFLAQHETTTDPVLTPVLAELRTLLESAAQ